MFQLDVKNQIRADDEIEYIAPDIHLMRERPLALLDENMAQIEKTDHGKVAYIRSSLPLRKGYLMRKENKDKILR